METNNEITIKGWVARDKSKSHGCDLHLFAYEKPIRREIMGDWSGGWYCHIPLDTNLFPHITYEDEPQEVEITIKIK